MEASAALPIPTPAHVWAVPSESLVPLAIAVAGGGALALRATPGCCCADLAERVGLAVGDRLVCGGIVIPDAWTVANLPCCGGDGCGRGPLIGTAPAGSLVSFRLSICPELSSAGAVAGAATSGFPAEVEVVLCGQTLCALLVDAAAAAHGACARACTLKAAAGDGGPPFEVDLGGDEGEDGGGGGGGGGTTLEELVAELADGANGSQPTLIIGLRVDALRLATTVAADGGPASAQLPVFAARGMPAGAVCVAAFAGHGVPPTAAATLTARLLFRQAFYATIHIPFRAGKGLISSRYT